MIGCIGSQGFSHHTIKQGLFKKEDAAEWIKDGLRKALAVYEQPVVLVIDNAVCHSNVEHILTGEFKEHKIIRLAPYSPILNSIEPVWSVIKSKVKSLLAEQIPTLLKEGNHTGFSRVEFRA